MLNTLEKSRPSQAPILAETQDRQQRDSEDLEARKDILTRVPLSSASHVMCLGESSGLSKLVSPMDGADVVHYPLPKDSYDAQLDPQVMDILRLRGAFLRPSKSLSDDLVDSFFRLVAPIVPIINQTRFMEDYQNNRISLLLLNAVLLAGSRVCTNPEIIMNTGNSTTTVGSHFYKRAKVLYDSSYECDRVIITQALVLMGWYCAGDIMQDAYHWTSLAVITAQSSGMHRKVRDTDLGEEDRKLWKRIWWTLFTRDRSIAIALRRPVLINPSECDVEMICEDDFVESKNSGVSGDSLHIQFFLQYVKVCKITGHVLSQHYSVASRILHEASTDTTDSIDCEKALSNWLQNCPEELFWEETRHNYWPALLHGSYYTTRCLLSVAEIGAKRNSLWPQHVAFHAADRITAIVHALSAYNELRHSPESIVYSLYTALDIYEYQQSTARTGVQVMQEKISVCMSAVNDLSHIWLLDTMRKMHFESIFGDKFPQEPRPNKQNKVTNITEPDDGHDPLESLQNTEYNSTNSEFKQPTFNPDQICADKFTTIDRIQYPQLNLNPISGPGVPLSSNLNSQAHGYWANALPVQCGQPDIHYPGQENWEYNQAVTAFQGGVNAWNDTALQLYGIL